MKINPAIVQTNLVALQQQHPALGIGLMNHLQHQRLRRVQSPFELRPGEANLPTIVDHRQTPAVSMHTTCTPMHIKQSVEKTGPGSISIVIGLGAGYALLAYHTLLSDRRVILIEPLWDVLFEALRWFDATALLSSPNLMLLGGNDAFEQAREILQNHPSFVSGYDAILHGRDLSSSEEDAARSLVPLSVPRSETAPLLAIGGHAHKELIPVLCREARHTSTPAQSYIRNREVSPFLRNDEGLETIRRSTPNTVLSFSAFALRYDEWRALGEMGIRRILWLYDDPQRTRSRIDLDSHFDQLVCFDPVHTETLSRQCKAPVMHLDAATSFDDSITPTPPDPRPETLGITFVGSTGLQRYPEPVLRSVFQQNALAPFDTLARQSLNDGVPVDMSTLASLPCPDTLHDHSISLRQDLLTFAMRRAWLLALTSLPLTIFGDAGWNQPTWVGALTKHTTGTPLHFLRETPWVYQHSAINLNVFNVQCINSPTVRMLDVMRMGGFLLSEHRPFIDTMFTVGEELDTFHTPDELREKCAHYMSRPEERTRIAQAGQRRVIAEHQYRHRLPRLPFPA